LKGSSQGRTARPRRVAAIRPGPAVPPAAPAVCGPITCSTAGIPWSRPSTSVQQAAQRRRGVEARGPAGDQVGNRATRAPVLDRLSTRPQGNIALRRKPAACSQGPALRRLRGSARRAETGLVFRRAGPRRPRSDRRFTMARIAQPAAQSRRPGISQTGHRSALQPQQLLHPHREFASRGTPFCLCRLSANGSSAPMGAPPRNSSNRSNPLSVLWRCGVPSSRNLPL